MKLDLTIKSVRGSSRVKSMLFVVVVVLALGFVFALALIWRRGALEKPARLTTIRYGITPYQDSALPVVANELGWYRKNGIDFKLVPLAWGDVVIALSSGSIDVAIYNFNSFQAPYENAAKGSRKPIFYCPTYVFKGQAIMVHGNSEFKPFEDIEGDSVEQRERRLEETASQLRGKRVAITEGTELEQIVVAALNKAGLDRERDVTLIHASPENALAAFLAKDVDAFAAGLTERTEARRHGAVELLMASDVMLPVIDGIITTEDFALKEGPILDKLVRIWFQTIRFMEEDLTANSQYILRYLAKAASTRYSPEEYRIAWTFNVFPKNIVEANSLFNQTSSPYYWRKKWDKNNAFLQKENKISYPVPYKAYWGDKVLLRLNQDENEPK